MNIDTKGGGGRGGRVMGLQNNCFLKKIINWRERLLNIYKLNA